MLKKIHNARASLSKSEQKVADIVIRDPEKIMHISMQGLAQEAGVSDPTVLRFCRELGVSGFKEFKLQLAQGLASKETFFYRDVSPEDSGQELSIKVIDSAIASLVQVKSQLDEKAVEAAINCYQNCQRVEFYGSGGSGVVATDAQLKFFRLGKPTVAYSDPHIQHATAALLDKNVLVIAISASGYNKDLIHTLEIARKTQAKIVAITSANSPISRLADVTLSLDVTEDSDSFASLKSRIAQIVVLDILAVGAGVKGGTQVLDQIERARHAIDFKFLQ
ncbi:MAG: MurR/RpiR family transcriptional regulator [Thiolinea sp.]